MATWKLILLRGIKVWHTKAGGNGWIVAMVVEWDGKDGSEWRSEEERQNGMCWSGWRDINRQKKTIMSKNEMTAYLWRRGQLRFSFALAPLQAQNQIQNQSQIQPIETLVQLCDPGACVHAMD